MIVAVEVVAKLGDSIIEIARVERGGTYASPLVPFPLICGETDGFVVHRPVGVTGWRCGAPLDDKHDERRARSTPEGSAKVNDTKVRIGPTDMIILALGRVTLYVLPILERAVVVPKKRRELRPCIYGAVVLVAHLFIWGLAEASFVEPLEKLETPHLPTLRVHVTHVEEEPPPPPPPPKVAVAEQRTDVAGSPTKGRAKKRERGRETTGGGAALAAFGDLSMLIPSVDVVKLVNESVAYDEQAAEDAKWGGSSGHFDPFRDCKVNCGTIASGPYETLSFQNRPKPIPHVAITSDDASVKAAVIAARATLVACHVERAVDGDTGSVQVELKADTNGAFGLLYSRGLDGVGPCVGAVIDALHLKGTTNATASITIAFRF